jgi:exodeoxyribonuclease VII large subunit
MLNSLSYKNVLARGYAIVRDKDNKIISTTTEIPASIEFSDGILKI